MIKVKHLYCPHCNEPYDIPVIETTGVGFILPNKSLMHRPTGCRDIIHYTKPIFDITCPSCCQNSLVDIDPEMLDIIILLNAHNFETAYCCSGHFKNIDVPYINFMSGSIIEELIKEDIVSGYMARMKYWRIEQEGDDRVGIYVLPSHAEALMSARRKKTFRELQDRYIVELRTWAIFITSLQSERTRKISID